MCQSLENRYKEKEIEGAIKILKTTGLSDNEIISKIVESFQVTKEYVMALLSPKSA